VELQGAVLAQPLSTAAWTGAICETGNAQARNVRAHVTMNPRPVEEFTREHGPAGKHWVTQRFSVIVGLCQSQAPGAGRWPIVLAGILGPARRCPWLGAARRYDYVLNSRSFAEANADTVAAFNRDHRRLRNRRGRAEPF